jgi:hypothetical protein
MEQFDYWSALKRGWWLIVVFGLVGLAIGLKLPRHPIGTSYSTTSEVGVAPYSGGDEDTAIDRILYYGGDDSVLAAASKNSGLNWPTWLIRDLITLTGPPSPDGSNPGSGEVGVVDVSVFAPTAADSLALNSAFDSALGAKLNSLAQTELTASETSTEAKLASIYSEELTNRFPPGVTTQALQVQISALQNELASLVVSSPSTGYEVIHTPVLHEVDKVTSNSVLNSRSARAALGLLIGLVIGAVLALLMWLLDRRLKTAKRAEFALGYPVAAEIPRAINDSSEAYRMLWLSVFREPLPSPPQEEDGRLYNGEDPVLDRDDMVGFTR